MKRVIIVILQTLLLLIVFAAGSFVHPLHLERVLSNDGAQVRVFVWDGLILMFAVYALLMIIAALRKRLMQSGLWITLALVLATVVGLVAKLGFITHDLR